MSEVVVTEKEILVAAEVVQTVVVETTKGLPGPAGRSVQVYEAASQAAMLALSAEPGDYCDRSDVGLTFLLAESPATDINNWRITGQKARYERTFTTLNLSIIGLLPVNHNLGYLPSAVTVLDESGDEIDPDAVTDVTTTGLVVNLESFAGFTGTWTLTVS